MTSSIRSRGPTIKARVIVTGLSIQRTLELLDEPVDRAVDVRIGLATEVRGAPAARREQPLLLLRDRRFGGLEDRIPAVLGLRPERVPELQRLPPRGPEDPLPLREDLVLGTPDLVLHFLDSLEGFLLLHEGQTR